MAKSKTSTGDTNAPVLNNEKSICTIGDVTLKIGDTIDYKPSTEDKLTMGKILEFKHPGGNKTPDTSSVWMNLQDMGEKNMGEEWVSVIVWHEQYLLRKPIKVKKDDTSKKPANTSERPF